METEKIEEAARPETTLQQLVFGVQLQVVVGARRVPLLQTVDIRSSVAVVTNFGGPLLATREFLLDPAQIRPILVTARLPVRVICAVVVFLLFLSSGLSIFH